MVSPRPVNTQTVPLRPAGGAQRAKRSSAPSGVRIVPLTTLSGTGFAGIETSVMRGIGQAESAEDKGRSVKMDPFPSPLERRLACSHIIFVQAATSVSARNIEAAHKARPDRRAGSLQQSLNGGLSMRTYDL